MENNENIEDEIKTEIENTESKEEVLYADDDFELTMQYKDDELEGETYGS